ncbi:hypothetical protein GCM10011538_20550 [Ligilactobacillus murinus]
MRKVYAQKQRQNQRKLSADFELSISQKSRVTFAMYIHRKS